MRSTVVFFPIGLLVDVLVGGCMSAQEKNFMQHQVPQISMESSKPHAQHAVEAEAVTVEPQYFGTRKGFDILKFWVQLKLVVNLHPTRKCDDDQLCNVAQCMLCPDSVWPKIALLGF